MPRVDTPGLRCSEFQPDYTSTPEIEVSLFLVSVSLLFLSFHLLLSDPGSPGWLPLTTLLLLLLLALYEHPSEFPFSLLPLWFLLLFLMFLWFLFLV